MTGTWIFAIGALGFVAANAAAAPLHSDARRPSIGVAPEIVITAKREATGLSAILAFDAVALAQKMIARDESLHRMPALHVASATDAPRLAQNGR